MLLSGARIQDHSYCKQTYSWIILNANMTRSRLQSRRGWFDQLSKILCWIRTKIYKFCRAFKQTGDKPLSRHISLPQCHYSLGPHWMQSTSEAQRRTSLPMERDLTGNLLLANVSPRRKLLLFVCILWLCSWKITTSKIIYLSQGLKKLQRLSAVRQPKHARSFVLGRQWIRMMMEETGLKMMTWRPQAM